MNSDPHESAAWRTFGMLDADEAAGFDEAIRHDPELRNAYQEMDRLSTAVAVATTIPVVPRAGQLERLHARLGLNVSKHTNWLGISGWAAAAALTLVLVLERPSSKGSSVVSNGEKETPATQPAGTDSTAAVSVPTSLEPDKEMNSLPDHNSPSDPAQIVDAGSEDKPIVKLETKRLIQEIEILRDKLENFQERDRKRFEPVAGMAWPIVMRMVPPGTKVGSDSELLVDNEAPTMTAMLGDALTAASAMGVVTPEMSTRIPERTTSKDKPSAVPIYDAARDIGTLVVSNLPAKSLTERFNLWVKTDDGGAAVYVGRLPESNYVDTEPVDFSLGSTGIVPSAFILTKDNQADPVPPTAANIILQGPN